MDADRESRGCCVHEVDGLGGLQPRPLQRYEDDVNRLRRDEQRVPRVVEPPVDDVAKVGAVREVALDASVRTAHGGDFEARSRERVSGGYGRGIDARQAG